MKLIELMGIRQKLDANIDKMVQQGTEKLTQEFPNFSPAFSEEWGKRMKARLKVEDFVNIVVMVYEKHYTNDDLVELIKAQKELNIEPFSPALRAALDVAPRDERDHGGIYPTWRSTWGEIGKEIATEHPDWVKAESSAPTPPAKQ